jgi:hypothetical protein
VSDDDAHRNRTDDCPFAVKPRACGRAVMRLWGLTAQRDRADKNGRPSMHIMAFIMTSQVCTIEHEEET